eukprot:788145_1
MSRNSKRRRVEVGSSVSQPSMRSKLYALVTLSQRCASTLRNLESTAGTGFGGDVKLATQMHLILIDLRKLSSTAQAGTTRGVLVRHARAILFEALYSGLWKFGANERKLLMSQLGEDSEFDRRCLQAAPRPQARHGFRRRSGQHCAHADHRL